MCFGPISDDPFWDFYNVILYIKYIIFNGQYLSIIFVTFLFHVELVSFIRLRKYLIGSQNEIKYQDLVFSVKPTKVLSLIPWPSAFIPYPCPLFLILSYFSFQEIWVRFLLLLLV